FVCRSTAPGANRAVTHSHPQGAPTTQVGPGSFVGAPPDRRTARCEPGKHTFAPRGCSYNTRWAGLSVGAPPDRRTARCEPVRHTFAPEAGAPTVRGGASFICRSTAPGANGQAQTSPEANATSTATPTAPSTPPNSNTPPPNSPPTNSTTPAWPTAYPPP